MLKILASLEPRTGYGISGSTFGTHLRVQKSSDEKTIAENILHSNCVDFAVYQRFLYSEPRPICIA
jgi:hypothetical protein